MTHEQIERAEVMWRTMTCREIAPLFGVTPECLRQNFHRWGIKDPKDRRAKDRELAIRFRYTKGWTTAEIAEQICRSAKFVRTALRDMARRLQLCLWPMEAFRVERPRMRVVHRSTERVCDCRQLELFSVAA